MAWSKQRKQPSLWRSALLSMAVLLGMLAVVWLSAGSTLTGTREEQLQQARQAVMRAVVTCYAIEGVYPPNLSYLEDHYGLVVDEDRFFVDYEAFASNVLPQVMVYEAGWEQ